MGFIQNILFLSDLHLTSEQPVGRVDDAPATCVRKFRWALEAAIQHEAAIVQAGDMFQGARDWQMLNEVARALREYPAVPFFCIYGQHDMYMRSLKSRPYTAMGILAASGLVTVLDAKPVELNGWQLYGCSYGDEAPKPEPGRDNILVYHGPVCTQALFEGFDYQRADEMLAGLPDYRIIHCGDVHRAFFEADGIRAIFNTGPLFRREATEYNLSHQPTYAVMELGHEGGKIQWYEVAAEPADKVLSREHIEEADARKVLSEFIEAVHVHGPLQNVSIVDRVKQAVEEPDVPGDVKGLMLEVMNSVK